MNHQRHQECETTASSCLLVVFININKSATNPYGLTNNQPYSRAQPNDLAVMRGIGRPSGAKTVRTSIETHGAKDCWHESPQIKHGSYLKILIAPNLETSKLLIHLVILNCKRAS